MDNGDRDPKEVEQQVFWEGNVWGLYNTKLDIYELDFYACGPEDCTGKSESRVIDVQGTVSAIGVNELNLQTVGCADQKIKVDTDTPTTREGPSCTQFHFKLNHPGSFRNTCSSDPVSN